MAGAFTAAGASPVHAPARLMQRMSLAIVALALLVGVAQAAAPTGARPASAAAAQPAAPVTAGPDGAQVYARWCVHCHGSGRGNPGTDSLQTKYGGSVPAVLLERTDLTAEAVSMFVRQGVLSMPPFRKTEITDAELAALASYMTQRRPAAR